MTPAVLDSLNLQCLVKENAARKGLAWTAYLAGEEIPDAAQKFLSARYLLEDIAAMDLSEGFLVSYTFESAEHPGARIALRVIVPHDTQQGAPRLPSIAHIYQGAEWHEREAMDFYGLDFTGNPNPLRLLLPADMHDYPLRKDASRRASLRSIFASEPGEIVRKLNSFTLLDPEKTEAAPPENAPEDSPASSQAKSPANSSDGTAQAPAEG